MMSSSFLPSEAKLEIIGHFAQAKGLPAIMHHPFCLLDFDKLRICSSQKCGFFRIPILEFLMSHYCTTMYLRRHDDHEQALHF